MKKLSKLVTATCTALLILMACDSIFTTPISKILNDPRGYEGKQVTISGTVIEAFSVVVARYFIVRDKTGDITVVTNRVLPKKGEKITVRGHVEEAFSIGDKQLIVIIEDSEKR